MKRVGYLYEQILNLDFIKNCIIIHSKGKTYRRDVRRVLNHIDKYSNYIYDMIKNNSIKLKPTHNRGIKDSGKKRQITVNPFFPNQILDYLITDVLKPIVKKSMYQYCIGNVNGRGIAYGAKFLHHEVCKYQYFKKLDIHHFYQNIQMKLMFQKLQRKIKDQKFFQLLASVCVLDYCPIGCYYSQGLSNFFLEELDHLIKEKGKIPCYIRYVDDMVLLSNNYQQLIGIESLIADGLATGGLSLKFHGTVRSFSQVPLNFLGFRFTHTGTGLRRSLITKISRTLKSIQHHLCISLARRIMSYIGGLKAVPAGYIYYKTKIAPIVTLGRLRRVIQNADIKNNSSLSFSGGY